MDTLHQVKTRQSLWVLQTVLQLKPFYIQHSIVRFSDGLYLSHYFDKEKLINLLLSHSTQLLCGLALGGGDCYSGIYSQYSQKRSCSDKFTTPKMLQINSKFQMSMKKMQSRKEKTVLRNHLSPKILNEAGQPLCKCYSIQNFIKFMTKERSHKTSIII